MFGDRLRVRANVRVLRFDPSEGTARYEMFSADVEGGMTVLELLQRIKDTQDSSLTFRGACRSSICGCCALRVNGKAVLACRTQALPALVDRWQHSIDIAPLRNLPVLRDLVVDVEPLLDRLARLHPYLIEDRHRVPETLESEALVSQREAAAFERNTDCILCGTCQSECSSAAVDDRYAGPMALAKAYRFSIDPRDAFDLPRMQAAQDHGLWLCAQCRKCVTVCPKDTRPAVAIQRLRRHAIDQGIRDTPGSRRAKAYTHDVVRLGQVNKPMLPVVVNGTRGWVAVEQEDDYLRAHGVEPVREVRRLPGQPWVAKLAQQVEELEAELAAESRRESVRVTKGSRR